MKIDFQQLPEGGVEAYLDLMIGKLYKILPLYEDSVTDARRYTNNYLRELIGFSSLGEIPGHICEDADFFSILCVLRHIGCRRCSLDEVKSDVFKAISLCKALKKRHFGGEPREL